jgi:hypothetical protein
MKTTTIIVIAVACVTALLLLALYMRKEKYEAPAPAQATPPAVTNAALEALKNEISSCNQDNKCIQNIIKKNMQWKSKKNNMPIYNNGS